MPRPPARPVTRHPNPWRGLLTEAKRSIELDCHSAWGPNADRRGNLLNCLREEGQTLKPIHSRSARLIEYDPAYCDTILRRFERMTGKQALLSETGETFEDVEQRRGSVALSTGSAA